MPNRILKEAICTSADIAALSVHAERFWYRLIVQVDDFGRYDGRPAVIRARCFPLNLSSVSESDVVSWAGECIAQGMIEVYRVEDRPYIQLTAWEKHQQRRAKVSKYPDPISSDITCKQTLADVPVFVSVLEESRKRGAEPSPITESVPVTPDVTDVTDVTKENKRPPPPVGAEAQELEMIVSQFCAKSARGSESERRWISEDFRPILGDQRFKNVDWSAEIESRVTPRMKVRQFLDAVLGISNAPPMSEALAARKRDEASTLSGKWYR